ncbi:hypothetical protein BDP27DRAFT_1386527 [Rhodocollybia butyracea]|uniref:C2H2-type domain-containing protein n=1 Tax=Rhodocollybia butyracea TaxID=206335 RepID=A0A9P5TVQ0_9AGAR|nr:hypothetical protein BDP27DRAFT_1386527 [Rhodocollybia butyracea]
MYRCTRCPYREFASFGAYHAHCSAKNDHPYCTECQTLFRSFDALDNHDSNVHQEYYESSDEEDNAVCQSCNREFRDTQSLYQHLASSSRHNWCFACSRDFSSPQALAQHSSSQSLFKMVSAIAQHVESGSCNPRINRHTVTQAIHSLDLIPTISINRRITGGSASATRTITNYSATELAYNGRAYECYLCHRLFSSLGSLNSHLNSPAHDSKEFKCPKCAKRYALISGFV